MCVLVCCILYASKLYCVPFFVRRTFIMNLFLFISWALDSRTDYGHDIVISYGPTVFLSLSNWFSSVPDVESYEDRPRPGSVRTCLSSDLKLGR